MITKKDRNKLKKLLGGTYTIEVIDILSKRGVLNKCGNLHSLSYISKVLNGVKRSDAVEDAIYELAKRKKATKEERKSILS